MFDRDLPQGLRRTYPAGAARRGHHGKLSDADPTADRGGERDPRVPELEAVRGRAVPARKSTIARANGRPANAPSAAATTETINASPAISRRT